MIKIAFAALGFLVVAPSFVRAECVNPPPVFDCADWHREDGRLVAKHALTAGLLGIDENSYIGDHTMIGGLDYSEALRRQCDAKVR